MGLGLISSGCVKHEALTPHLKQEVSGMTGQVCLPFRLLPSPRARASQHVEPRGCAHAPSHQM